MKFFVLSVGPNCTCLVVQTKGVRVMVDCPLDSSQLMRGGLLQTPRMTLLDMASIQIILLSHYASFAALPFITEHTPFEGVIYATEPTAQLGQLHCSSTEQMAPRPFLYTATDVAQSCERIQRISFGQRVPIPDGHITAVSSGLVAGGANWSLRLHGRNVFVLGESSSASSRHALPLEVSPVSAAHCIVVAPQSSEVGVARLQDLVTHVNTTVNTHNGSVLLPLTYGGAFLDLVELLSQTAAVPVYVVGAKALLTTAQVSSEYLNAQKRDRAFAAETVFRWNVKFVDPNEGSGIAIAAREKCIVFAEHPSLRMGPVVELLQLMGPDARNALILTDPTFEPSAVLTGLRLKMRTLFVALDARCTSEQVASVLARAPPACVIACPASVARLVPAAFALPAGPGPLRVKVADASAAQSMRVSAADAHTLRLAPARDVLVATVVATLDQDGRVSAAAPATGASAMFGTLTAASFMRAMQRLHGVVAVDVYGAGDTLVFPTLGDARVTLGASRTLVEADSATHRDLIAEAIAAAFAHTP